MKKNTSYIGKTKDELLLHKGPPYKVAKTSEGKEIWFYKTVRAGIKKGTTISIGKGNPVPNIGTWVELIAFIIDKNGIVENLVIEVE
ncbi:hypothetical protein [Hydrogenimonas cancrithermarum]|uniref:hypothetical protein n=1 Tax=Hydrogenimonas cancrithermarum TaxID=2993563 RepID=UPI002574505E|nr:hypothetical protein [Hydrogenimonas cancrithermarum]